MNSVTAMMKCESTKADETNPDQGSGSVHLRGVTGEDEEYKTYFQYTPYAELNMGILNPSAYKFFQSGKIYKVTFEPIEQNPPVNPA